MAAQEGRNILEGLVDSLREKNVEIVELENSVNELSNRILLKENELAISEQKVVNLMKGNIRLKEENTNYENIIFECSKCDSCINEGNNAICRYCCRKAKDKYERSDDSLDE